MDPVVSTLAESVTVATVLPAPSEGEEAAEQAEGSNPADKGDPLRTFLLFSTGTYVIISFLSFC